MIFERFWVHCYWAPKVLLLEDTAISNSIVKIGQNTTSQLERQLTEVNKYSVYLALIHAHLAIYRFADEVNASINKVIHLFQLRLLSWTMLHSLQCTMVNPFVVEKSSFLFTFIEIMETICEKAFKRVFNWLPKFLSMSHLKKFIFKISQ